MVQAIMHVVNQKIFSIQRFFLQFIQVEMRLDFILGNSDSLALGVGELDYNSRGVNT
jgi:hypothetical protein